MSIAEISLSRFDSFVESEISSFFISRAILLRNTIIKSHVTIGFVVKFCTANYRWNFTCLFSCVFQLSSYLYSLLNLILCSNS